MPKPALLILEDGTKFEGISFGADGETLGEAVFNTSMAGYQEILTDPSYINQLVVMTYPMIGNYGVVPDESESGKIQVAGFAVREYCKTFTSRNENAISLGSFLKEEGIMAIEGIDTRRLTKHLRERGAMRAGLSTEDLDPESLLDKVLASPSMNGQDLTGTATCSSAHEYEAPEKTEFKVAALDCGIKENILRHLKNRNCRVTVFPATATADEILASNPDGIFISNGPGDPAAAEDVIATLKKLIGKKPVFGICLGHQMLCNALGANTYKLKFGHRGGNHPVKNMKTGRIEISSQNHGFCVDDKTLPEELEITHMNLNDMTVEGIRHKTLPVFSVQYHPENAPGPHDSEYVFDDFIGMMRDAG